MSDRDKLIELISYFCEHMPHMDGQTWEEACADHLIANGVTLQQWIPVSERLPESGVHVLVACEVRGQYCSGRYVCDGFYAKANTQPSYGYPDECVVEYSEEDDEYYLLEGWYEVVKNWDDYSSIVIDDFVTHWMPLPSTEGLE